MNSHDVHALTAAYALDALDQPERQRYERHLAGCPGCRTELGGFREVAGRLGTAVATDVSPRLRERVVAAVVGADQSAAASDPRPRARRWRAAAVAAVAAVVAAAVVGVVAANSGDRLTTGQHAQREIAAVLSAPDGIILHAPLRTGGTATVVMSPHMQALVVAASGVRPAPTGMRYQLWLMKASGDTRAGTLPTLDDGPVVIFADGAPADLRLGISLEQDAHAARPSIPMLAIIQL